MKCKIILALLMSIMGNAHAMQTGERKLELVQSLALANGNQMRAYHDSFSKQITISTFDKAGTFINDLYASYSHNEVTNVRFLGFAHLPDNATFIALVGQWVNKNDTFKVWKFDGTGKNGVGICDSTQQEFNDVEFYLNTENEVVMKTVAHWVINGRQVTSSSKIKKKLCFNKNDKNQLWEDAE